MGRIAARLLPTPFLSLVVWVPTAILGPTADWQLSGDDLEIAAVSRGAGNGNCRPDYRRPR